MNKLEFAMLVSEAFDAAKTIVHQRQRGTPTEFLHRVQRLSVDFKAIENCEHWQKWPKSPVTFGKFHRAGDSAMHVAFMFTRCVDAAIHFAKLKTIGMPKDLDKLTQEQLSAWMEASRIELETTTLELSNWSPAELMRDADLLQRQIRQEFEQGTSTASYAWTVR